MTDLCVLCCDEKNANMKKIKCLVCTFECCNECYKKLNSNVCPNCRDERYNIAILHTVIQQYQNASIMLYTENLRLSKLVLSHKMAMVIMMYIIFGLTCTTTIFGGFSLYKLFF